MDGVAGGIDWDSDDDDDDVVEAFQVADQGEDVGLHEEDLPIDDVSEEENSHACAALIQVRAAEFLSFIREDCCTTQSTVNNVVKGVDDLFKLYNKFLKAKLFELSDTDVLQKEEVAALFDYMNQQTLFEGVQTAYRMNRYQQTLWKAIVPRQLVLTWRRTVTHGKVKQVPDKVVYYVDFLTQLEAILQCKDILDCIDNPHISEDGVFRLALDGYVYQNHQVRQIDPKAIGIILYLDDALPIESLSSYQDHSIRNYSWTIANIFPELRSSVRSANLLALVKASVAKEYKNRPMLKNFIEGTNRLSSDEGVTFNIRGVPRVFHGFLLMGIGDFPALANIGGFKESASFAWRFCRQCLITQEELRLKFKETEVTLRSADLHQNHLEAIGGNDSSALEEEDEEVDLESAEEPTKPTVKYGVNFRSPLLDLLHFDVTQQLPQDIMHLFLEGILESGSCLLLNHAIHDRKLSLKNVNVFISSHDYGKLLSDKPSPIQPQHLKNGLRQTSSQMLMLSLLLPFIVKGHCENTRLKNFILLLMIFSMCMSHEISMSDVNVLTKMIEVYLSEFNDLYPGKITAKHHFLIHLPTQIVLFSVLTEQWAMRFEAFFSKLKRLTKLLHNARNLACSLMIRVCASVSYKIHTDRDCFLSGSVIKPKLKEMVILSSLPFKDCILKCLEVSEETEISELASLKWYGSKLSEGDTILLGLGNTLPKFGTIAQLFFHEKKYIIVYRELTTVSFCSEVNAYVVKCEPVGIFGALDITNMKDMQLLVTIKHASHIFVLLRRNRTPEFASLNYNF